MTKRWPKNLHFLIAINCYRLSSIAINCYRLSSISIYFGKVKNNMFYSGNTVEWNYITVVKIAGYVSRVAKEITNAVTRYSEIGARL